MNDEDAPPLAWSYSGDRFEPPHEAVGWRVRRKLRPGKHSRADAVWVEVEAIRCELVLELWAPLDHLRAAVQDAVGMYRLDPVDDEGWVLRSEPAFTALGGSSDSDLHLYPDLAAELTSDAGWRTYLATLPVTERERARLEGLCWSLSKERFLALRSELVGLSGKDAVEQLLTSLPRR